MIKVRIIATGEIREVTSNIAHDLIDRKVAELASLTPSRKTYFPQTEDREASSGSVYLNRQMRSGRTSSKKEEDQVKTKTTPISPEEE